MPRYARKSSDDWGGIDTICQKSFFLKFEKGNEKGFPNERFDKILFLCYNFNTVL